MSRPLSPERSDTQAPPARPAAKANEQATVLIVEDSPTQSLQLKALLERGGWAVAVAANGREALAAMTQQQPLVVLSDVVMPNVDGYELCRAIRRDPALAGVPVVLLTVLSDPVDVVKGLACGADNLLVKPYDPELLLSCVEKLARSNGDCVRLPDAIRVSAGDEQHVIDAEPERIMRFLLSTCENAARQYRRLGETETRLRKANAGLEENVHRLAASEARFRSVVQTVPDIVYRIDPEGRFVLVNDAATMLGYEPEELIGRHFSEIILPADVDRASRDKILPRYAGKTTGPDGAPLLFDERRTGARMTRALEIHLLHKSARHDGVEPLEIVAEVNSSGLYEAELHSERETFVGSVGVIRDITRRKEAERELARHRDHLEEMVRNRTGAVCASNAILREQISERLHAEETLRRNQTILAEAQEVAHIGNWDWDIAADTVQWSDETYRILGLATGRAPASREALLDAVHPDEREAVEQAIDASLAGNDGGYSIEHRIRRPDGTERLVHHRGKVFRDDEGAPTQVLGVIHDVSERAALEARLLQSQKMDAIGRLAGGVAHDFNNILTGIKGYAGFALEATEEGTQIHEDLTEALGLAQRAADLTRRLLTFSR